MRTGLVAALALLASTSSVQAAPAGFSLSSILQQASQALHGLGIDIVPSTDSSKHGPVWRFDIGKFYSQVVKQVKHDISWHKKFQGWDTFKANGVNLGPSSSSSFWLATRSSAES